MNIIIVHNSFNINWDAYRNQKLLIPFYTLKNYQIYICKKSINNDLILFETSNNSETNITITNNVTSGKMKVEIQ